MVKPVNFSLFYPTMRQSKFVSRKAFIILTVEYDYYNISPVLRLHESLFHLSRSAYALPRLVSLSVSRITQKS